MSPDRGVEERINGLSDRLFTDMGVQDDRLASTYIRRSFACDIATGREAGLEADQAWYARKTYALREGKYDDDALLRDAVRSLEVQGFSVTSYTSSSKLRLAIGVKDDMSVRVLNPPLDVVISAGPCGASFTGARDFFTRVE